jgi:hypothetical protein
VENLKGRTTEMGLALESMCILLLFKNISVIHHTTYGVKRGVLLYSEQINGIPWKGERLHTGITGEE